MTGGVGRPNPSTQASVLSFAQVAAALTTLPDLLPPAPQAITAIRVDTREPVPRTPTDPARVRPAAVLVLLLPGTDGDARVLLTERVDRGGHHSGEVSFPGGAVESSDADRVATALREAAEEVALDPVEAGLRVIGILDPFWIPVSGFHVTPVLAIAERRPTLQAAPSEVARIVEAPLSAFLPHAPVEIVERNVREWRLRYGGYPVDGLHVWGATARILGQLGALIADLTPGPEGNRVDR
jgi:8-oxo-dGTP pyrophosphatase MutT (NUDIX family)